MLLLAGASRNIVPNPFGFILDVHPRDDMNSTFAEDVIVDAASELNR